MPSEEFSNKLSKSEVERLAYLAEECAEVQKEIMKILRHGFEDKNPLIHNSPTNREKLALEMGHVLFGISLLAVNGDVSNISVVNHQRRKSATIHPWLRFRHEIPEGSQLVGYRIQERSLDERAL